MTPDSHLAPPSKRGIWRLDNYHVEDYLYIFFSCVIILVDQKRTGVFEMAKMILTGLLHIFGITIVSEYRLRDGVAIILGIGFMLIGIVWVESKILEFLFESGFFHLIYSCDVVPFC